eukprot:4844098-Prymnesium_polylepis.1
MAQLDSYINVDAALLMLGEYAASRPWWLASHPEGPTKFARRMDESAMAVDYAMYPRSAYNDSYMWAGNDGVWFVSQPVAR